MIKNVLKRRKECGTYLATARGRRWRVKMTMKVKKVCSHQRALRPSSAEEKV